MIMYDVNEGFDAFKTYLALRQHFTSDYDYFKYKGKVKAKIESFLKRKDKFFFRKLQKKYSKDELVDFFVSNFIAKGDNWIGNLISKESEDNYETWRNNNESSTYRFSNDILFINDFCRTNDLQANDLILVNDNDHPKLLLFYFQNKISIETLIILDRVLGFVRYWDAKLDDVLWDEKKRLIYNYRSFVKYDLDKCKQIVKDQ